MRYLVYYHAHSRSHSSYNTRTQSKKVFDIPHFDYSGEAGQDILVIAIVLGYSVMAPLVCLFGLIYFAIVYLVDKYNVCVSLSLSLSLTHSCINKIIFANETHWDGGGTMWQYLFHFLMATVLLFQLTMVGVLGLAKFGGGSTLLVLPLCTVALWVYLATRWYHASVYGSLGKRILFI